MKFQYQITIFFIIAAIFPLSVFGYVTYNDARDSLIVELSGQLSLSADLTKNNLMGYLDEAKDNLYVLSTTDVVLDTFLDIEYSLNYSGTDIILFSKSSEYNKIISSLESYLTRFLEIENEYFYDNIYLINKDGTVIYSKTKHSDFGTNLINGPYSNTSFGKTVKASIDEQSLSISNIENYEPLNNSETIFMIAPIFIGENNFSGIIVFQIPFYVIDSIISDPIGLGETGESVLAKRDDNGDAMFISSLKHVFSKSENRISKDRLEVPITQALLRNEMVIINGIDYRNVSVIAATRYIESMDWGLVVKEDVSEAFSSIYAFQDNFVLAIIIVGILISIFSIVLSLRIVRPLKKLEENMMNVDEKTHEIIVDNDLLSKKDEIGYLAKTFSKMLQKHKEDSKKISSAEKMASIGMIAGTLSHEIRNPLGTISNVIYLLSMNKEKLDEKTARQLKIIQSEIERINGLISEFYSFAKINQLEKVSESLNKVIDSVLETHKFPENISVKTVLHKNLPKMLIDFDKMRQVFINIIDNAVSAMPDGGRLDISSDVKNKDVIIKISNTGEGIPEDKIGLIFDPLYTTKSSGLGLGLAIVKKIVESHNGVIEVENGKDKVTFIILFSAR